MLMRYAEFLSIASGHPLLEYTLKPGSMYYRVIKDCYLRGELRQGDRRDAIDVYQEVSDGIQTEMRQEQKVLSEVKPNKKRPF